MMDGRVNTLTSKGVKVVFEKWVDFGNRRSEKGRRESHDAWDRSSVTHDNGGR